MAWITEENSYSLKYLLLLGNIDGESHLHGSAERTTDKSGELMDGMK